MLFAGLIALLLSLFPSFTEEAKVMVDGYEVIKNIPNKYLFLTGWFLTGFSILHLYPVLFSRKVRTVICVAVASVILAAAIVIAAFFCFIYLCHPDDKPFNYSEGRSFNQADWNRRDVYYDDRKYVVDDLMKNHLPQGMPYRKVTDLLGESSPCFPSKDSTTFALSYEIEVLHRWADIDPYETVYLHVIFSAADSLLIDSELK
jgi:hypothetical protein